MKDAIARLKKMNWKEFGINHGEKIVLGLVCLLLLFAFLGTKWTTYDREFGRTPDDLQNQVAASDQAFGASTWPATEAEKFPLSSGLKETEVKALLNDDENARISAIQQRLGQFAYSTELYWPLYPRKEKIKEPEWVAVEDLIADAGRVILEFKPRPTQIIAAAPEKPKPAIDAESAVRTPGLLKAAEGEETAVVQTASKPYGEGQRYVSVRGIFPLYRQLQKVATAMNEPNVANVASLIDFMDFKLYRQTAVPGADPWAGEWELITLQSAIDILSRISDFDTDVVDFGVTDQVFTMPLPRRVVGFWVKHATHPKLENFQLSFEQMQAEQLLNEKMIEEHTRQQREAAEQQKVVQKSGFTGMQHDIRNIRSKILSGPNAQQNQQKLQRELDKENVKQDLIAQIRQRETAAGRLLLFRYIDFNVKPGNSYRYKVQLVLRNPFVGRPQKDVASPEIAIGETRTTPESVPTAPVTVPVDTNYFLADIKSTPRETKAILNVFQWYQPFGTFINAENMEVSMGDFVGGKVDNTKLLDPSKPEFRNDASVVFETNDVLVDINAPPSDLRDVIADLGLDRNVPKRLGIVDQVLVANQYGEMVPLDPVSGQPDLARARTERDRLWEPFNSLLTDYKNQQANADSNSDLRNRGNRYDNSAKDTGATAPRRANPLRKP